MGYPDRRVIVITGASSGFGRGAALAMARRGHKLVLAARRKQLLEELADDCRALGAEAIALQTDVGHEDQVQTLSTTARETFGRIDVWINNAGVGVLGRFDEIPPADHIRLLATNLHGTLYGSHCALREFKQKGQGILINVASALGKIPAPYYASYTASKYGIVGLSAVLRQELSEQGLAQIRVCTVMPMAHDTPFFDHTANYTGHQAEPIPPLYEPKNVVDVLVDLLDDPQDEVVVGGVGKAFVLGHNLMPAVVEGMMAHQTHRVQMERAEPADITQGALYEPIDAGSTVSAGRLA
jgi:short-subunit dehydrogenase